MTLAPLKSLRVGLGLAATAVLLSACGGGGSGASAPPTVAGTDVPVSATQQSAAAIAFVKSVVARGEANQDDPLTVGGAVLASSESDDPDR